MLSLQTKARRLGWWMGTVVAVGAAAEMALIGDRAVNPSCIRTRRHSSHPECG
jgi:hypothetical protein